MITKGKHISNDWVDKIDLSSYKVPKGKGKDVVWQSIFERMDVVQEKKIVTLWPSLLKVAAIFVGLALVGSLTWILVFGRTSFYSPLGEHLTVELPDGSKVTLNADTHLGFNKNLWRFSRSVDLEGEALFTVKKGESFSVRTGDITTLVKGTVFNVYSRNNQVRVSCIEGSVAVIHSLTKQMILLTPSQKTELIDGSLHEPETVVKTEMATWINGEFYFNNENLETVFGEIERQFNVKVHLMVSSKRFYSGVFFNKNLNEALDLVCVPMQLEWKVEKKVVMVTEK